MAISVANALGYLLNVVAIAILEPTRLGELAAWLAVVVVANTGAVALQAVTARRVAEARAGGFDPGEGTREALRTSVCVAMALTGTLIVLAPLLAFLLHVSVAGSLLVALLLAPLTVAGALLGVLQGWERFSGLAAAYLLLAIGKVGGGLIGLTIGGPELALAGTAVGATLATGAVLALARPSLPVRPFEAAWPAIRGTAAEVLRTAGTVGAIFALAAADILSARAVLTGAASGEYAVGNIVTRGAFWLPQFVAVLAFPRLADPSRRSATLRLALATIALLGLVAITLAELFGDAVVGALGSDDYSGVAPYLPWFALLGTLQAAVQLLVYDGLARRRSATASVVWCGAAVVLLATATAAGTVLRVAVTATTVTALVVLALTALAVRDRRVRVDLAAART